MIERLKNLNNIYLCNCWTGESETWPSWYYNADTNALNKFVIHLLIVWRNFNSYKKISIDKEYNFFSHKPHGLERENILRMIITFSNLQLCSRLHDQCSTSSLVDAITLKSYLRFDTKRGIMDVKGLTLLWLLVDDAGVGFYPFSETAAPNAYSFRLMTPCGSSHIKCQQNSKFDLGKTY